MFAKRRKERLARSVLLSRQQGLEPALHALLELELVVARSKTARQPDRERADDLDRGLAAVRLAQDANLVSSNDEARGRAYRTHISTQLSRSLVELPRELDLDHQIRVSRGRGHDDIDCAIEHARSLADRNAHLHLEPSAVLADLGRGRIRT